MPAPYPYQPNYGYREHRSDGPMIPPYWQRRIKIEEAMGIAVARVPGEIVKIELEYKNGTFLYEVDIITAQGVKYEVEVDANSGNILSVKVD